MKKILLPLLLCALASCKKETPAPLPAAQAVTKQQPQFAPLSAPIPARDSISKKAVPAPKPFKKVVTAPAPQLPVQQKNNVVYNHAKDSTALSTILKSFEEPAQVFTIPSRGITKITGKNGTILTINPAHLKAINGKRLGKTITVALKELTTTQSLLKNNAQTTSGDKLLVSGGSYYIGLESDGNLLELKNGKTLAAQFPVMASEKMDLFYGDRTNGKMDWKASGKTFNQPATAELNASTNASGWVMGNNSIAFRGTGAIDMIPRDSIAGEGKPLTATQKKAQQISNDLYKTISLNKLGWINCDRFYKEPVINFAYTLNPADSISYATTFLVFKDINSVVGGHYSRSNKSIRNMPVNRVATFIVIAFKEDRLYAASRDIVITPGMHAMPRLIETSEQGLAQLFEISR